MKKITSILGALILSAIIGCGGGISYTPMTKANRSAISSVELYNLVIQDEVKPSVEMSNASLYLGGGLIAAAIDSSVNEGRSLTAQDIIEPLYNVTEDLDYRKLIAPAVNSAVGSEFKLEATKEAAEAILLTNDELNKKVNSLNDDEALLYLSSFYNFVNNSKTLATSTVAFVYMKPQKKEGDEAKKSKKNEMQLIYFNNHNYLSKSVGEGAIHSMKMWSEDGGKLFRDTLQLSLRETTKMLMYDLQPELDEVCARSAKVEYNGLNGLARDKGTLVKTEGDRYTVRIQNGALISMAEGVKLIKEKKNNEACVSKGEV